MEKKNSVIVKKSDLKVIKVGSVDIRSFTYNNVIYVVAIDIAKVGNKASRFVTSKIASVKFGGYRGGLLFVQLNDVKTFVEKVEKRYPAYAQLRNTELVQESVEEESAPVQETVVEEPKQEDENIVETIEPEIIEIQTETSITAVNTALIVYEGNTQVEAVVEILDAPKEVKTDDIEEKAEEVVTIDAELITGQVVSEDSVTVDAESTTVENQQTVSEENQDNSLSFDDDFDIFAYAAEREESEKDEEKKEEQPEKAMGTIDFFADFSFGQDEDEKETPVEEKKDEEINSENIDELARAQVECDGSHANSSVQVNQTEESDTTEESVTTVETEQKDDKDEELKDFEPVKSNRNSIYIYRDTFDRMNKKLIPYLLEYYLKVYHPDGWGDGCKQEMYTMMEKVIWSAEFEQTVTDAGSLTALIAQINKGKLAPEIKETALKYSFDDEDYLMFVEFFLKEGLTMMFSELRTEYGDLIG